MLDFRGTSSDANNLIFSPIFREGTFSLESDLNSRVNSEADTTSVVFSQADLEEKVDEENGEESAKSQSQGLHLNESIIARDRESDKSGQTDWQDYSFSETGDEPPLVRKRRRKPSKYVETSQQDPNLIFKICTLCFIAYLGEGSVG